MRFIDNPEESSRYNYETTQEDMKFLSETKDLRITVTLFEWLINFFEKRSIDSEEHLLPPDIIAGRLNEINPGIDKELALRIYEYWKKLRTKAGGKKGLLRKYWKPSDPANNDPRVTFRRLKDEKRSLRRNRKYDEEYLKKVMIVLEG